MVTCHIVLQLEYQVVAKQTQDPAFGDIQAH